MQSGDNSLKDPIGLDGAGESTSLKSSTVGGDGNFFQNSIHQFNQSAATVYNSVHFESIAQNSEAVTETEMLQTEDSMAQRTQLDDLHHLQLMQISEEEPALMESPLEIKHIRAKNRYQAAGALTNNKNTDGQLLSQCDFKQLDEAFFEQRNKILCFMKAQKQLIAKSHRKDNHSDFDQSVQYTQLAQHLLPRMSQRQMTALTGGSEEVQRADLFIKGSPTINPGQNLSREQTHNFTLGPKNSSIKRNIDMSYHRRSHASVKKEINSGTARLYNNNSKVPGVVQWRTNQSSSLTKRNLPLQTSQGLRGARNRRDLKSIDLANKTAGIGWKDLVSAQIDREDAASLVSRSCDPTPAEIDQFHQSDIVRNSYEVMPNEPLRHTINLLQLADTNGRMVDGTRRLQTLDDSTMAASTARETYSKHGRSKRNAAGSQKIMNSLHSIKSGPSPKKNRALISTAVSGPHAPQIKKFAAQSFVIFSDLQLIHKRIDAGEIGLDMKKETRRSRAGSVEGQETLAQQALQANKDVEQEANRSYAVYIDALQSAIGALPQPQGREFQLLLNRIHDGFKNQNAQISKFISRQNEMHNIARKQQVTKMEQLEQEFELYREHNDLERYFAKNLSEDTRERVLDNVKYLMKATDWHEVDKFEVEQADSANPQQFLNRLLQEIENQQKRKNCEIAEEREEMLQKNEMFGKGKPPMTANAFSHTFEMDLHDKVIKRSVDRSSDVALSFMKNLTTKYLRNQGSQSETMEELFVEHSATIKKLNNTLNASRIHETCIMAELNRISGQLVDSRKEQNRLKVIADKADDEKTFMQDNFGTQDRRISDLQLQNDHKAKSMLTQQNRIKQLEDLMVKQKAIELDLKSKIAMLVRQIEDMGVEIDKTTSAALEAKNDANSLAASAAKREQELKAKAEEEAFTKEVKAQAERDSAAAKKKEASAKSKKRKSSKKKKVEDTEDDDSGAEQAAKAKKSKSSKRKKADDAEDDDSSAEQAVKAKKSKSSKKKKVEDAEDEDSGAESEGPGDPSRLSKVVESQASSSVSHAQSSSRYSRSNQVDDKSRIGSDHGDSSPRTYRSQISPDCSPRASSPEKDGDSPFKVRNESPMPRERRRKQPISKFNADLPRGPGGEEIESPMIVKKKKKSKAASSKKDKKTKSKSKNAKQKDKTNGGEAGLTLEPIQVQPLEDESEETSEEGDDENQENEEETQVVKRKITQMTNIESDASPPPILEPRANIAFKEDIVKKGGVKAEQVVQLAKSQQQKNPVSLQKARKSVRQAVLQKLPDGSIVSNEPQSSTNLPPALITQLDNQMQAEASDATSGNDGNCSNQTYGQHFQKGDKEAVGTIRGSGSMGQQQMNDIKIIENNGFATQVSFDHYSDDHNSVMDPNCSVSGAQNSFVAISTNFVDSEGNRESLPGLQNGGSVTTRGSEEATQPIDNVVIRKKQNQNINFRRWRNQGNNARDNTAQTALELEIIYACDLLLQELAGPRPNRRQSLMQSITENEALFKKMSKEEAAKLAEQLVLSIDKIRSKASAGTGIATHSMPAAQLFNNHGDQFEDIHENTFTDQGPSWHFARPDEHEQLHQQHMARRKPIRHQQHKRYKHELLYKNSKSPPQRVDHRSQSKDNEREVMLSREQRFSQTETLNRVIGGVRHLKMSQMQGGLN